MGRVSTIPPEFFGPTHKLGLSSTHGRRSVPCDQWSLSVGAPNQPESLPSKVPAGRARCEGLRRAGFEAKERLLVGQASPGVLQGSSSMS
jgi:hypothetical protein